jgi:hypothetical protein
MQCTKGIVRIKPHDATGYLRREWIGPRISDFRHFPGQREACQTDLVFANTVRSQSPNHPWARGKIVNIAAFGVHGHPDSVHIGIGYHTVNRTNIGLVCDNCGRIERGHERGAFLAQCANQAFTKAQSDQPVERKHRKIRPALVSGVIQ